MDGWACILDRDGYVLGSQRDVNTTFYCPDTLDVEGMKDGQTGTDPGKPRGWTDWPMQFVSVGSDGGPKVATTIPKWGYNKIIRVSYWMNAYNPIGSAPADISVADVYYSASIGLGPDSKGKYIHLHKLSSIRHPSQFIVLADGVYMGRQSVTRLGDANSRIGYRHPGMSKANGSSNVAFADGHVESITGDSFPRATGGSVPLSLSRQDNLGSGPTIYADPEAVLGP
jgi:prepilin-type processing-associated H-X9-DG protein